MGQALPAPALHVYESNQSTFVFTPDLSRPGTEIAAQREQRHPPDVADEPEEQARPATSASRRARPSTGRWRSTLQPDASNLQNLPKNNFETVVFRSTISSKLLFEAGMGNTTETWTREPVEDSPTSKGYPVTELNTGISFRAYPSTFSSNYTSLRSYRSSLTYVTGSHAFKWGMTLQEGPADTDIYTSKDTFLIVRNAQPFQVSVRTTPYTTHERLVADLGVYGQDTWTIKRLTVNAGLRWDYLNNKVGAQDAPGGTWIGPRHFDELSDVPNFKDISPRLGVAYDLFGNGKTALKATLSRYVQTSTVGFARLLNPLNTSVNSATRTWNDAVAQGGNGDGIPQVSELGPLSNTSFGQVSIATRYDPDDHPRLRPPPQQLGGLDDAVARARVARFGGGLLFPPRAGALHDHRQSRRRADRLQLVLRHRADRCAAAQRRRLPGLRPLRHHADEIRSGQQQPGHLRRQHRQADRGVQRRRHRDERAAALRPVPHRRAATGNTHFNACDAFVDNPHTAFGLSAAAAGPAPRRSRAPGRCSVTVISTPAG